MLPRKIKVRGHFTKCNILGLSNGFISFLVPATSFDSFTAERILIKQIPVQTPPLHFPSCIAHLCSWGGRMGMAPGPEGVVLAEALSAGKVLDW